MSLDITSEGVDPVSGATVEFYRPAGPESSRSQLWGQPIMRSRFPMLSRIEHDLCVVPSDFQIFEDEAHRLEFEAIDVTVALGRDPDEAERLVYYARTCLEAVEFARKYKSKSIHYW